MKAAAGTPWYRVPTVWLLIALPFLSVVGGFVLLAAALETDDGLVIDDYYRHGREINRELARDHVAAALAVTAHIAIDPQHDALRVALHSRAALSPDTLRVQLLHATKQGNDHDLALVRGADGVYRAPLADIAPGHYYIQLAAGDWRLVGGLRWPGQREIDLRPDPSLVSQK